MSFAHFFTNRLHAVLEPWQSAGRKGRLRDFDLHRRAVLPVVELKPDAQHCCNDPLCGLLIADARRFHQRHAPRRGLMRATVPTAMLLDLDRFPSGEAYARAVSKRSHGNVIRAAKKAVRLGVTWAPIRPESHAADIAAIAASKRFRSGGPVLAAWFGRGKRVENTRLPASPPPCATHWTLAWGAFVQEDDGPRLIAHLSLRRVGDMCRTHELMAHGDHLNTGAMKLLFLEVAKWLMDRQAPETQGLRWFMYGALEHGARGLHDWKRLMCFEPANLAFASPPEPVLPSRRPGKTHARREVAAVGSAPDHDPAQARDQETITGR